MKSQHNELKCFAKFAFTFFVLFKPKMRTTAIIPQEKESCLSQKFYLNFSGNSRLDSFKKGF